MAVLTDLFISAACFLFSYLIYQRKPRIKTYVYYRYYFLLMGVATLLGGLLGHGFLYALNFYWKLPGWITSMFAIMLLERATIEHTKLEFSVKSIKWLRWVNVVEFLLFLSLTLITLEFKYVEFHSGYGLMVVVLGLEGLLYYKNRNSAGNKLLMGVGLSAIAAAIFSFELTLHKWFDHIALSHVFLLWAAYLFYRGVLQIDMKDQFEEA